MSILHIAWEPRLFRLSRVNYRAKRKLSKALELRNPRAVADKVNDLRKIRVDGAVGKKEPVHRVHRPPGLGDSVPNLVNRQLSDYQRRQGTGCQRLTCGAGDQTDAGSRPCCLQPWKIELSLIVRKASPRQFNALLHFMQ